jgi:hypothetical protein
VGLPSVLLRGLPVRAGTSCTSHVPKPINVILPPLDNVSFTVLSNASKNAFASFCDLPVFSANAFINYLRCCFAVCFVHFYLVLLANFDTPPPINQKLEYIFLQFLYR